MKDKEINKAIAEACGWIDCGEEWRRPDGSFEAYGPDYCTDLNEMHEVEDRWFFNKDEKICSPYWFNYCHRLMILCDAPAHATARQRSESFLRTIGKWVD